jgi:transposase
LTVHGRRLLVERVVIQGRPCSHVAKELGISRQRAGVWVMRYLSEGEAGLHDRSSRPHTSPTRTTGEIEAQVLAARAEHRRGQDWLGGELGVAARTVSRVLRRHHLPGASARWPPLACGLRSSGRSIASAAASSPFRRVAIVLGPAGEVGQAQAPRAGRRRTGLPR